jgi:hypothetical protein
MSLKDVFTLEDPLYTVLNKMCEVVGTSIGKVNFNEDKWYSKYSWTQKQEDEFQKWFVDYLYNNYKARKHFLTMPTRRNKKYITKAVRMWLFQYGWKYKK